MFSAVKRNFPYIWLSIYVNKEATRLLIEIPETAQNVKLVEKQRQEQALFSLSEARGPIF